MNFDKMLIKRDIWLWLGVYRELSRLGFLRKRKGPVSGTKGLDRFRSEETFYANPLPGCLCRTESLSINASQYR